MNFTIDKQTAEDLNLLGKYRPHSIQSIFNQTKTHGGGRLLESMFNTPLTDPAKINQRVGIFQHFQLQRLAFPFNAEQMQGVETFMSINTGGLPGLAVRRLQHTYLRDDRYQQLMDALGTTIGFLKQCSDWLPALEQQHGPYNDRIRQLRNLLNHPRLLALHHPRLAALHHHGKLGLVRTARYIRLIQRDLAAEMETMLEIIYELDVYIAVSNVAAAKGFSYAIAYPKDQHCFSAEALWHPGVAKAVANPLHVDQRQNMLFLTGANMAGKSTFMKSVGIAVYCAHMGFPVAARHMQLSVRDGLYTSINVGDDLAQGYSHFYAEVLRVKQVAAEVSTGKDLVVIFDELFKGTNVKDAYDATLAVTQLMAAYRNCLYIVSTHIIEVGDTLKQANDNIQFAYLPTIMEGTVPRYPYTMKEGITADKHGMMIITNEGIIEILKSRKQ